MFKRITLIALALVTGMLTIAAAQKSHDEPEWKKDAREERVKKLSKLNLSISTAADNSGAPREQFRAGDPVVVRVGATNVGQETTVVSLSDPYRHYFPRLLKDGLPVPYKQKAKERLADDADPMRSNGWSVKLEPQAEGQLGLLPLDFWYDKLEPGAYQLTMRFSLDRTDRKVKTNTVVFEVVQ